MHLIWIREKPKRMPLCFIWIYRSDDLAPCTSCKFRWGTEVLGLYLRNCPTQSEWPGSQAEVGESWTVLNETKHTHCHAVRVTAEDKRTSESNGKTIEGANKAWPTQRLKQLWKQQEKKEAVVYIFMYLSRAMAVMVMVEANTLTACNHGTILHMASPSGQFFSNSLTRVNGVQNTHMIISLMAKFIINILRTVRSLLLRTTEINKKFHQDFADVRCA